MKKTFTLTTAVLVSLTMYAYNDFSGITVSASGNTTGLKVTIDGNDYRSNNDNTVFISNLSAGYHVVKIYQLKNEGRNRYFAPNYRLVYNAKVYVRPRYDIDITINRFGKAFYDEQPSTNVYNDNDDHHGNGGNDDHHDNNGNNNGWNNNDNHSTREMNAQSFNRFRESLRNESFENTRVNMAKQVIAANYFTTSQVKDILQVFNFENNKLELARYAYRYTIDKKEYYSLADCFNFSSNKDELIRYINNYR